jgi:hypothetical protein
MYARIYKTNPCNLEVLEKRGAGTPWSQPGTLHARMRKYVIFSQYMKDM